MNKKVRDNLWISKLVFIVVFVTSFSFLALQSYKSTVKSSFGSAYASRASEAYTSKHYGLSYRAWTDKEYEKCQKANPGRTDCVSEPVAISITDSEVFFAYIKGHPGEALSMGLAFACISMVLGFLATFVSLISIIPNRIE